MGTHSRSRLGVALEEPAGVGGFPRFGAFLFSVDRYAKLRVNLNGFRVAGVADLTRGFDGLPRIVFQTVNAGGWSNQLYGPWAYIRALSVFPERGPRGEDHWVSSSVPVKRLRYGEKSIELDTARGGESRLLVRQKPAGVQIGGAAGTENTDWRYDAETGLLVVTHKEPSVTIVF